MNKTEALRRLAAPAKLNLFLHVVGREPAGYHSLQTVFQFIDLYDYLSFECRADGVISLEVPGYPQLNQADNLIIKAAHSLKRQTGTALGAHIYCEKHIPLGAGLGGGSSNAATTLIALNQLWQTGLQRSELMRLGLTLGADVPVFIFGRPAFAEGVGEQLQAVPATPGAFLLLTPDIFVSTAQVFADPSLTRDSTKVNIIDFISWQEALFASLEQGLQNKHKHNRKHGQTCSHQGSTSQLEGQIKGQGLIQPSGQVRLFGHNDLQAVALRQHPQLAALVERLKSHGINVKVSGSGSSVFALFATSKAANRQHEEFQDRILFGIPAKPGLNVRSWVCTSLVEHPQLTWLD